MCDSVFGFSFCVDRIEPDLCTPRVLVFVHMPHSVKFSACVQKVDAKPVEPICHDSSKVCWFGEPWLRTNVCHLSRFFDTILRRYVDAHLSFVTIPRKYIDLEKSHPWRNIGHLSRFLDSMLILEINCSRVVGAGPIPLKFGKQQFFMNPRRYVAMSPQTNKRP